MKKQPIVLLAITAVSVVLTLGLFLLLNRSRQAVPFSPLPPETFAAPSFPASAEVSYPIDLNTADAQTLTALPGVGAVLAQRIVNYRQVHGDYQRPEELMNVEGIGPGKLEKLLDYVTTGG